MGRVGRVGVLFGGIALVALFLAGSSTSSGFHPPNARRISYLTF